MIVLCLFASLLPGLRLLAASGDIPIGWGDQDDDVSRKAIRRARNLGITFFDTADFYGLGHSETILGEEIGSLHDVVIATKVGHRLNDDGSIRLDYSKKHILAACEGSLRRLNRDTIDLYLLHSARLEHLEQGECIEAMERLVEKGNIRYWGLSLNTFTPGPEASFLMERDLGHGFQLVLNILNRRAAGIVGLAAQKSLGIIARMPLQFGMLSGNFGPERSFAANDHRSFRLTPEIIAETNNLMTPVLQAAAAAGVPATRVALGHLARKAGVSTIIPGIRTPDQADRNAEGSAPLPEQVVAALDELPEAECARITEMLQAQG